MESPPGEKRRAHVVTIDPDEDILTAFPYRPHNSLLDLLKGEPKVLGAMQILLSLIIVGFGIILAFNFIIFSKNFPLVIITGYPFWGALIFFLTGYVTLFNDKTRQILRQGVMTMNIISSVVAAAGTVLILISFTQQNKFCQGPSLEGTCIIGTTLLLGILSVLLIINIAELSISVTIAALRSRCWTKSKEAVFFFPSEVTQNTVQSVSEENHQLQFEFQGTSPSNNSASNIKTIFLGGYAFFKLRVSRNPSAPQNIPQKSDKGTSSMHIPDEQETIPPPSLVEEIKLNGLPPPLTPESSENIPSQKESRSNKLNDENLESITHYDSDPQSKSLEDQNLSLNILKTPSSHNLLPLLHDSLSSQTSMAGLSTQVLQSKAPSSHMSQVYDLTSEDLTSEDIPSQETPSQDTPSQDIQSQDTLTHDIPYQDIPSQKTPSQETLYQDSLSQKTPSQETPYQDSLSQKTPSQESPFQDTLSQKTPSQETPYQDNLSQKTPSQETPYQDSLSQKTPSQETPYQDSLSQKTPSQETPYQDTLSQKTLSQETPSQETPFQETPFQETPSQETPYQDTLSQKTPSQETPYQDALTLDMPSQETQSAETPPQEISPKDTPSQDIQFQDVLSQEKISQSTQTQDTAPNDMSFSDNQVLNTQDQIQRCPEIFYKDIRTEVMELTQEWPSNISKKPPRRFSLSLPGKQGKFRPKRHSMDLQIKDNKPPRRHSVELQRKTSRRKSIDQQIKAWISPKKHTTKKQDAYTQTSEQFLYQQADQQQAKEEEIPVQQSQDEQTKDQKFVKELYPEEQINGKEEEYQESDKEQPPEEQAQVQPAEDQQPQEQTTPNNQFPNLQERQQMLVKRAPTPLCENWDSQSFQFAERSTPSWQPASLGSQDWRSQGWRNKDWKAQEWQFEIHPSLDWESQELLERESLRQRALYQDIQPRCTIVQHTQDHQLHNFIFQVGLCQGNDQQDSESVVLRGDTYADAQTRNRDTEDTCQKPKDQQSEDERPDNYPASCQSLVPYTHVTCLSNIASEQEVQNNTPSSDSSKDLNATSSWFQRDQQQSEDSD